MLQAWELFSHLASTVAIESGDRQTIALLKKTQDRTPGVNQSGMTPDLGAGSDRPRLRGRQRTRERLLALRPRMGRKFPATFLPSIAALSQHNSSMPYMVRVYQA